jgi:hypothetical protein
VKKKVKNEGETNGGKTEGRRGKAEEEDEEKEKSYLASCMRTPS